MILDYKAETRAFLLVVERNEKDMIPAIMEEHGLDFSSSASTPERAVLFTKEPYAAVAFWSMATERAQAELIGLQSQIEASWKREGGGHIRCPADQELWPFQKTGVEYALSRNNCLIGDQPGLGKTMQAICLANEINAKRVLVVCPANIRLQWVEKIRQWTTMSWPYIVYPILQGSHGVHPSANWTIVSYDLARTPAIGRALAEGTYDLLVLDEGHFLKTIDSKRTRTVFGGGMGLTHEPLAERCGYICALSGTPLPNRPREAYTLARGLCWDAIDWMSEDSFKERFNPSLRKEFVDPETGKTKFYIDERTGRHGELQARLRANFMVRRMKHGPEGVMGQLKLPLYDIVYAEETGAVKQALAAESLLDIDPETLAGADAEALGHIAVVRRKMGLAIAPLAADYAAMCLDGGEDKIVVFGHHIEVLNILCEKLAHFGVVRIDGSLNATQKQARVNEFVANPDKRVCAANMLSAGTGTDGLQQAAWHAIFAEADWTPGNNQQAVDRLDRGGQEWQVQADFIVARNSFSEKVLASAIRKNQVTDKALDRRL
jgi:SWI/SNF-related matrix-associated actin-dependent regulator 1 of chromatin subfamily A